MSTASLSPAHSLLLGVREYAFVVVHSAGDKFTALKAPWFAVVAVVAVVAIEAIEAIEAPWRAAPGARVLRT